MESLCYWVCALVKAQAIHNSIVITTVYLRNTITQFINQTALIRQSPTSPFNLLERNIEPMIKLMAATPSGYNSPTNGSPSGLASVLLLAYMAVAIRGVSPPNTPLPM